ncbi:MAG: type II toxin-antitoxin system VapC family toxin [Rhizobiales bacterium]|nr:type II toxin-antitoxin system VapC family toxin [Hyphomicrobiales bacterium]
MTSTLVDSNVLIDIYQPGTQWYDWSSERIKLARLDGDLIINSIIASEVAAEFVTAAKFDKALAPNLWRREVIPLMACFRAGSAHREYRQKGGGRERTLPDFLVGAHAEASGHRILTRDARRYRSYFPGVEIIAPDTHP